MVSELVHVTVLSVTSLGETLAVIVAVSSTCISSAVLSRVMPVASITTETLQVAVKPLWVVAVIVALPTPTATTTPSVTVATVVSELVHVTVLSVTSLGKTVAVIVAVSSTSTIRVVLSRVMLVASTFGVPQPTILNKSAHTINVVSAIFANFFI